MTDSAAEMVARLRERIQGICCFGCQQKELIFNGPDNVLWHTGGYGICDDHSGEILDALGGVVGLIEAARRIVARCPMCSHDEYCTDECAELKRALQPFEQAAGAGKEPQNG